MRRFFVTFNFLFISVLCFSQQNIPVIKQGAIPTADDPALYEIQVGAFSRAPNAANAFNILSRGGFSPVLENIQRRDITRVIVRGIPSGEVKTNLERIGRLGFVEVIIRKDTSNLAISEKWSIPGNQGSFSSFEFTHESRYIAVERAGNTVHFGEYTMPTQNIIKMNDLGTLNIGTRNNDAINFSFSPVNDPSRVESVSAVIETPMQRDFGTDLITRAWRVVHRTGSGTVRDGVRSTETIGRIYLHSINGTYLVTKTDGTVAYISHWRWVDDRHEEFDFSHDNWQTYGRTKIVTLNQSSFTWKGLNGDDFAELVPAYTD
jgi:hypothetical protein